MLRYEVSPRVLHYLILGLSLTQPTDYSELYHVRLISYDKLFPSYLLLSLLPVACCKSALSHFYRKYSSELDIRKNPKGMLRASSAWHYIYQYETTSVIPNDSEELEFRLNRQNSSIKRSPKQFNQAIAKTVQLSDRQNSSIKRTAKDRFATQRDKSS